MEKDGFEKEEKMDQLSQDIPSIPEGEVLESAHPPEKIQVDDDKIKRLDGEELKGDVALNDHKETVDDTDEQVDDENKDGEEIEDEYCKDGDEIEVNGDKGQKEEEKDVDDSEDETKERDVEDDEDETKEKDADDSEDETKEKDADGDEDETKEKGAEDDQEETKDDEETKCSGKVEDLLVEDMQNLEMNPEESEEKQVEDVIPEIIETPEEKLNRIKEFYDTDFARPDLEPQGQKSSYVIIKYENYQKPFEAIPEKKDTPKKRTELNEGNAKIAEYFGEDLNSDEEFEQLLKQVTDIDMMEKLTNDAKGVESEKSEGDKSSDIPQDTFENKSNSREPACPTIYEENENIVNDVSSSGKHKEKTKADKKRKPDLISSKVHIRHLPQNMRKEEFLEAIGPLPEYNYLHFTSGAFMSRVCSRKCTGFCHINFMKQEDADAFVSTYRIFIIRDERGDECFGSAEFAINQRLPKIPGTIQYDSQNLYDMPKDEKFLEFKRNYDANILGILGVPVNQDGSVTADVMINEIEERNTHKNELQTTPLLAYIIAQANKSEKDKKFGGSLKKTSEKSRITIKKERKRDRRDRRERKDREKDKVRSSKDEPKLEAKDTSKPGDKRIKQRNSERSKKPEPVSAKVPDATSKEKDLHVGDSKKDVEKKLVDGGRDKHDSENKKGKTMSPPKKYEKRGGGDKRSSGGGKPESRPPKSEASSSTSKTQSEKPHQDTVKTTNAGTSETTNSPANVENDKSGPRKKTVKKIIKVKKVVKKGDESEHTGAAPSEKKEREGSSRTDVQPSSKKLSETSKPESGATQQSHDSNSTQETKRSKKARPDMQIYRPGSLRNKLSDPKAGAGDTTSRKGDKDKPNDGKSSKEGKTTDKLKHGDS